MSRKNVFITIVVLLIGAAVVAANVYYKKDKGLPVTTDVIKTRDLEAIVSASGKIQAKRTVNVSSDTVGRVVNLAVNEGDRVKIGQFLLQIDPKTLRSRVDSGSASLQATILTLEQMKQAIAQGSQAGRGSQFVVYDDAGHAFFADYRPSYRKADAEDGWRRTLVWFKQHGVA